MKLDLTDKKVTGLDGRPILQETEKGTFKEMLISDLIAGVLANGKSDDSLRAFDLAKKFHAGGEIDLGDSDKNFIKKQIKECPYTDIAKAQMLLILEG